MRKYILLLFLLIFSSAANAFYYAGLYFYPNYDGSCELRGFNPEIQISSSYNLNIPSYAKDENGNSYKVTRIVSDAFRARDEITHLYIPATVEEIGARAFMNCIGITECILFPSTKIIGEEAFRNCIGMVTLNTCAETIGDAAFSGCINLFAVYLGSPMKEIGNGAFMGCSALTNIDIPFTVEQLGHSYMGYNHGVFEDCLALAAVTFSYNLSDKKPRLKRIYPETFKNCINLRRLDFPYSLTHIYNDAFLRCTSLKHIEWGGPETLQVSSMDFTGVPISRIVYHGNVTMQSTSNMQKLAGLAEVRYDTYATEVQNGIFSNIPSLTTVHLDKVVKINGSAFSNCTGLKNLTLSPELESIDYRAFNGCTALTNLTIPDNVTYLGQSAFENCANLKNVSFGKSLNQIDYYCFQGCSSLEKIILPMSVSKLGFNCFGGCIRLKSFTMGGPTPTVLSSYIAQGASIEELHLRGVVKPRGDFGTDSGFKDLKKVKFTDYCDVIREQSFYGSTGITSVDFSNVKTIEGYAFQNCTGITSVDLSNVEEIGTDAFYNCSNLENVKFGNKIKKIPDCLSRTGIMTLNIPDNVTAFSSPRDCEKLVSVRIGDGVVNYDGGFYNCNSLNSIYYGASISSIQYLSPSSVKMMVSANPIPPQLRYNTFTNTVYRNCELTVPKGSLQAYKNAEYWKNFFKITEADLTGIETVEADPQAPLVEIIDGVIKISASQSATIYSLDGRIIQQLPSGEHQLYLNRGVYILVTGNVTKKFCI